VEAERCIEEVDGKMLLTHVSLKYHMKIPKERRASVEKRSPTMNVVAEAETATI
jgi:hypothetical protein